MYYQQNGFNNELSCSYHERNCLIAVINFRMGTEWKQIISCIDPRALWTKDNPVMSESLIT